MWSGSSALQASLLKRFAFPGFHTILGVFTISGLHVLPIWLYGMHTGIGAFLSLSFKDSLSACEIVSVKSTASGFTLRVDALA